MKNRKVVLTDTDALLLAIMLWAFGLRLMGYFLSLMKNPHP